MSSAALEIKNVTKTYGTKKVLNDLSFQVEPGEFIVLVGPSGCGKSTMLRSIAGLNTIDSGEILIAGKDVSGLPPKARDIAMVFQDYALYPHMNVAENIAFGLKIRRFPKDKIDRLVNEAAAKLNLTSLLGRKPAALSGGQRQRVAIGRAIVRDPKVFLFDEPLSNLDAKLRGVMRLEIAKLHKELKTTIVYVTHDQVEAMTLADKIVVLDGGFIQQMGTPLDLYYHPKNIFVAQFIGSPPMNMVEGTLESSGDQLDFVATNFKVPVPAEVKPQLERAQKVERVVFGVRPENFKVPEKADGKSRSRYTAKVIVTELLGANSSILCTIGGHEFHVNLPEPHRPKPGDEVTLDYATKHFYLFDQQTGDALVD